MSSSILTLPKLVLVGVALAAAGSAVWHTAQAPLLVKLAEADRDRTRQLLRASEDTISRLQVANARGDELTQTLLKREDQINQLSREKHDAIAQATTGRLCLDGPALRLLNSAAGLRVAGMPSAPSGPVATGATAATHPDDQVLSATDADITGWAIDAGAQYEICRGRLDTLIDWHPNPPAPTSPAIGDRTP
jgi:hypothetical protein